jgi:hypothetical protein
VAYDGLKEDDEEPDADSDAEADEKSFRWAVHSTSGKLMYVGRFWTQITKNIQILRASL